MQKNAKTMGGRTKGMLLCIGEICSYNVFEHSVISIFFSRFYRKKDIQRDMQMGLYMFIQSMKSERISPFALDYSAYRNSNFTTSVDRKIVEKIIEEIPAILKKSIGTILKESKFFMRWMFNYNRRKKVEIPTLYAGTRIIPFRFKR